MIILRRSPPSHIRQVKPGIYVHDFNCGWLHHPSEAEFEIMKSHVREGDRILNDSTYLDQNCTCVALHHHERLDGTGYPYGLKGDQISLFGQMAAIIDIYDALCSERCYKEALAPTVALRKLFEWSESYLNRDLVEKFIAHVGIYPIGAIVRLSSGFIGVVMDHGETDLLHPVVRVVCHAETKKPVRPFDIDIAKQRRAGNSHEIIGCESSDKWKINPERFLT